jgi:hypothetical protein
MLFPPQEQIFKEPENPSSGIFNLFIETLLHYYELELLSYPKADCPYSQSILRPPPPP